MATLGEKVTETIVTAIGRGLEGGADKHKARLGELVKPLVQEYLQTLPADHPMKSELSSFESNTGVMDIVAWVIGLIPGIVMMILALADPYAEEGRQWAASSNPNKLAPAAQQALAQIRGHGEELHTTNSLLRLGYATRQRDVFLAATRQLLPPDEVREATLRGIPFGESADAYLAKYGFTPAEISAMKALWQRIPPVQDLIRMAVREAFTPDIAEKFGQYADFPADVATYAAQQGLAAEWAKRYWAAHWDLPSVTQGFEMLHRGVINQETLDMLLRAQDVMPYWRDKLTAIAYNPLTRVDVRRMYHLEVLDDAGVTKAYRELGYSAENAARLLEFTKVYYGPEDEDPEEEDRAWTKAEILDGYRKRILTADQARTALREMGYPEDKANWYLAREDLKAAQSLKDAYVTRWRNLYINGVASADEVNTNLTALGMTEAELGELLPLWHLDKIMAVQRPTKAELTRWLKAGIITEAAWAAEMQLYGYSERHISWYLAEIKQNPELAIQEEQEG